MEKLSNDNENLEQTQNNQEALGRAALESSSEQQKFDGYIIKCANDLGGAGVHTEGYYEPEDGDTYEDALEAGFEERVDELKGYKKELFNLFKNDIDLKRLLDSGFLYDAINDMPGYEYDDREGQIFESIHILGDKYFGEDVSQSDKELMKNILYGENQDNEAQKKFLESKDDVISRRISGEKGDEALRYRISNAIEAANGYKAGEGNPYEILGELESIQGIIDERNAAGVGIKGYHKDVHSWIEHMKDIIEDEEFEKEHKLGE